MRKKILALTFAGALALAITVGALAAGGHSLFGDATIVSPGNSSANAVQATTTGTDGYGGIDFAFAAGTTVNDVNHLSTDLMAVTGTCATGTPRFAVGVNDGTAVTKYLFFYPTCTASWTNSGNLASPTSLVDATQLGGLFYMPYATVQADYGTLPVVDIFIVVDNSNGAQTIQFDNTQINNTLYTYEPPATTLTKSNNPTTIGPAGGTVTSTITFTNNGAATTSNPVIVTDHITTAGLTVTPGTITNTGTGPGVTCTSTNPTNSGTSPITTTALTTIDCTTGGTGVAAGATIILSIPMTVPANIAGRSVTDFASTNSITVSSVDVTPTQTGTVTTTQTGTSIVELRHVNEAGNIVIGQDVNNNDRGARHNVCLFNDPLGNNLESDLTPVLLATQLDLTNIQVTNGGGYKSTGDDEPNFTNPIFYTSNAGDSAGATCFSWTSTGAGDQIITVVAPIGGITTTIDYDSNLDGNRNVATGGFVHTTLTNNGLVKEWNVLETSQVSVNGTALTATSGAGTLNVTYNLGRGLTLNPQSGMNQFTGLVVSDQFLGSHTTSTGGTVGVTSIPLVGVNWTATLTGCGALTGATSGTTTLNTDGTVNGPSVTLAPGNLNCSIGSGSKIVFTGSEPGALGSGVGNTVTQTVNINFTQATQVKQVLLAWAGQRVILEHDWRIPAGDSSDGTPAGICPFGGGQSFRYIKSAEGPGNFITGVGAYIHGNDQADVQAFGSQSQEGTAPLDPQDSCISRVLYESEDQGEVDIESFANNGDNIDSSKFAYVIYYMKLNTVNVSLVNEVSKPTHNSSVLADYAPGNPWDASKDAASNTADMNVSTDILVRGRVTGWFTNSNPSGRARDASNPQNVLPADRWVMPDDWVNIAGGSALAGSFRPSYDLMFAPNNTVGLALTTPNGNAAVQLTATAAGSTATVLKVVVPANLVGITGILVGTAPASIVSISGTSVTVTGLTAVPAAGTAIYAVTGVPFEGPYSLVDVPNLAIFNGGVAGAALSNLPGTVNSVTRDTTQGDGTVDWWDAPMPPANISVSIRGTGFIKQVIKSDVYYLGTPNTTAQIYPNPYYIQNIPGSPFIPAVAAGGGYLWDSWGNDGPQAAGGFAASFGTGTAGQGPYTFWQAAVVGSNSIGIGDAGLTALNQTELAAIRVAYGDTSIARDLVVFSDNHGEFMVTANGDFKIDLTACAANALAGGKLCKTGDKVGTGTISAVADYPDFKKHFPVASNTATVNWTWGGYKDVTVEAGTTDQFKYVVYHAVDRDGYCDATAAGAVSLHPVLSGAVNDTFNGNPAETVDFLIDSGEGIIASTSGSGTTGVNDGKQFATGVTTYDVAARKALGLPTFPMLNGSTNECQAYVQVSNSLLGVLNVLTIAHNDEGNEGFDRIIDLTGSTSYTLNFRWSLITWAGANNIPVADALKGGASTANPDGNDISAQVTAVYGWNQTSQTWLGYFPSGASVPGANNLTVLTTGQAYWIAITGPGPVTWKVTTNVGS